MQSVLSFLLFVLAAFAAGRCAWLWGAEWAWRGVRDAPPGGSARLFRRLPFGVGLVCVVAVLVSARPVFGFAGLACLPGVVVASVLLRHQWRRDEVEMSGIAYLRGLQGLVHAGLGLSGALERLAQSHRTPFAKAMVRSLRQFETGASLVHCLDHVQDRVACRTLGPALRCLQLAYGQGLALAPLLDRLVPALEAEQATQTRAKQMRRAALVQAGVAFTVPWILVAVFAYAQPGQELVLEKSLVLGTLAVEGVGVAWVWRLSRFY